MIVHQDQAPVSTSYGWTSQILLKDAVRPSYALSRARDNAETESFFGRFNTENASLLQDAADLSSLTRVVGERICYYNRERRHSSLGNQAPERDVENLTRPQVSE